MSLLTAKTKLAISAVFCCLFVLLAVGGTYVWAQTYEGRIGPNTFIGPIEVSGLDPEVARQKVQEKVDEFYATGAPVLLDGNPSRLPLSILVGSDAIEVLRFEVDQTVTQAFEATHDENDAVEAMQLLLSLFQPNQVGVFISGSDEAIERSVRSAFPEREAPAKNASFVFRREAGTWQVEVIEGQSGDEFDFEPFLAALIGNLAALSDEPTPLIVTHRNPEVTTEDALAVADEAIAALNRAPLLLSYEIPIPGLGNSETRYRKWEMSADQLAAMLVPEHEMFPGIGLEATALDAFLQPIAAEIEIEALDARFLVENGRVAEFVGSRDGLAIDREELRQGLAAAVRGDAEAAVTIPTTVIEPEVTTEEANDLGISDVLGVGTSRYRGSPANRIKNIRNGVRLLNGLLIPPGETFSLLNALDPFDANNGYFFELVIKGDKIEPEMGGGLCQIGTTTFRATMNSGLPVVARSNHSLVVSYYNDPQNGNPGTDATIYDPAPDFQFQNDTGHYVLFQAEMLEDIQELRFTFWGTSDGRQGSYSPPVVTRWIGVGDAVKTETLDLPPGEEKCQAAHVGADASFTYTVVKPDGSVEERVFESHYRPLPEICLIGVEQLSTPEDLPADADGVSSGETADTPVEDSASRPDEE
jgi:vancomycin resistance protein YoaR